MIVLGKVSDCFIILGQTPSITLVLIELCYFFRCPSCSHLPPEAESVESFRGRRSWEVVVETLLLLVVRPGALTSFLLLVVRPGAPTSFLLLIVRPGAPSSILAPSSDALCSQHVRIPAQAIETCSEDLGLVAFKRLGHTETNPGLRSNPACVIGLQTEEHWSACCL